jgi:nitrogen regulatory protein PII
MKMVVALIRPEHRAAVLESVNELDACVASLCQVNDGGMPVVSGTYRGTDVRTHWPRLRLEVAVSDALVDDVVDAIAFAVEEDAATHFGTCHIFVMALEEWHRIPDVQPAQRSVGGEDRTRSLRGGVFDVTP